MAWRVVGVGVSAGAPLVHLPHPLVVSGSYTGGLGASAVSAPGRRARGRRAAGSLAGHLGPAADVVGASSWSGRSGVAVGVGAAVGRCRARFSGCSSGGCASRPGPAWRHVGTGCRAARRCRSAVPAWRASGCVPGCRPVSACRSPGAPSYGRLARSLGAAAVAVRGLTDGPDVRWWASGPWRAGVGAPWRVLASGRRSACWCPPSPGSRRSVTRPRTSSHDVWPVPAAARHRRPPTASPTASLSCRRGAADQYARAAGGTGHLQRAMSGARSSRVTESRHEVELVHQGPVTVVSSANTPDRAPDSESGSSPRRSWTSARGGSAG